MQQDAPKGRSPLRSPSAVEPEGNLAAQSALGSAITGGRLGTNQLEPDPGGDVVCRGGRSDRSRRPWPTRSPTAGSPATRRKRHPYCALAQIRAGDCADI